MGTGWNSSRRSSQSDALVGMSASINMRHSAGSRRSVVAGSADVSAFGKCTTMHGKSHLCTPGETVLLVGRTRYVEEDALRRVAAVYALFAGPLPPG